MIRIRAAVCVFLAVLVLPAGATVAERKSLIEVAAYWQMMSIPLLDQQKQAFEQNLHSPKTAAFTAALTEVRSVTRTAFAKVNAYILDRTQADEAAMVLALQDFCRAAKRLGETQGPFASVKDITSTFTTFAMASFLREEPEHDGIRKACED